MLEVDHGRLLLEWSQVKLWAFMFFMETFCGDFVRTSHSVTTSYLRAISRVRHRDVAEARRAARVFCIFPLGFGFFSHTKDLVRSQSVQSDQAQNNYPDFPQKKHLVSAKRMIRFEPVAELPSY
jgi:hypothetical protein